MAAASISGIPTRPPPESCHNPMKSQKIRNNLANHCRGSLLTPPQTSRLSYNIFSTRQHAMTRQDATLEPAEILSGTLPLLIKLSKYFKFLNQQRRKTTCHAVQMLSPACSCLWVLSMQASSSSHNGPPAW